MANKNSNSYIIDILGIKPVVYNPCFAEISGNVVAGIFMSHLLYWRDKGREGHGWIYKTLDEVFEETRLTRRQQETSIKIWKKLGCLTVELRGWPAKRYFYIEIQELSNLFIKTYGYGLPFLKKCLECEQPIEKLYSGTKLHHKKSCSQFGVNVQTSLA